MLYCLGYMSGGLTEGIVGGCDCVEEGVVTRNHHLVHAAARK
jgi:hypothetical protein